jgi:hypothetical protein
MTIHYVILASHDVTVRAEYAIRMLLDGIGVHGRRVARAADAVLVYSRERPADARDDALWLEASADDDWDVASGRSGPPDIVRETYAAATGVWERGHARNGWGVPVCRSPNDELAPWATPVVAKHCATLAAELEQAQRRPLSVVPRWPDGKSHAIVLSHDVDAPFMREPWAFYGRRLVKNVAQRDLGAVVHGVLQTGLIAKTTRLRRLPSSENDPNFAFAGWFDIERSIPARSCFYVAVTRSSDLGAASVDVTYDFRRPELTSALRTAVAGGWEVGLHVSVNARRRSGGIAAERERLESVLDGYPVSGSRHHYWGVDHDLPERTLWEHVEAGLDYDSSLGLNDSPGFRRGMAWPFEPFDRERGETVPILEVPPTLMDGAIFYQHVTPREGQQRILDHVRVVKEHGGAAVLDWHPEQLNPRRLNGAGAALCAVLPQLAADSGVHWDTPVGLAAWWRRRRDLIEASAER